MHVCNFLSKSDSQNLKNEAWIEGFAIFLGVFIVAGVGSWNDWQKEKQFLKLQAESEKDNTVSTLYSKYFGFNKKMD